MNVSIVFPVNILKYNISECSDNEVDHLKPLSSTNRWGIPFYLHENRLKVCRKPTAIWYSYYNRKYFFLNNAIISEYYWRENQYTIVGFFPDGRVLAWLVTDNVSKIILTGKAHDVTSFFRNLMGASDIEIGDSVDFSSYNDDLKQFKYRYMVMFLNWNDDKNNCREYDEVEMKKGEAELDYLEETLFDGTHDKLHDGGLMNYHQAGKPKKLAVKWHIKKSEYTAYFWFVDEEIRVIFDRFYGAHPETKTDFMIRIDAEHNKFELALFRYGLKEPQVISESAYQLLVFKNNFECYRSENYNQPKGAWIW